VRYQKQLFRHKPDEGIYGDCYRTAIACILGLKQTRVPHVQRQLTSEEFTAMYRDWLRSRGLHLIAIPFTADSVEAALAFATTFSDGMPFIFSGTSRTGVNHAVVGRHGEIACDPSLTDAGIIGPQSDGYYWMEFIVRSAEGRKRDRASAGVGRPAGGAASNSERGAP
jgi:hypothetical protein